MNSNCLKPFQPMRFDRTMGDVRFAGPETLLSNLNV